MSNVPKPDHPFWLTPEQRRRIDQQEYVVLSPLRQALQYVWVRLAVVVLTLGVVAVCLSLPPMWRSSPSGFTPVVRISLLEWLQCRSLKQSASQMAAAGKLDESILAWRQAIANNPADLEANRGFLRTLSIAKRPAAGNLSQGLWRAQWLLRITATNLADVEVVGHLAQRYEVNDLALALLTPKEARLSDASLGDLLRTLFRGGQMEQFAAVWKRHPGVERNDPELALYHTAWEIAWGPPRGIAAARSNLQKAKEDLELRVTAHELQLYVSDSLADLEGYADSLQQLRDLHYDRPLDHVRYWRMLLATGRKAEAAALARVYAAPPETALETRLMFDTFVQVDLKEYAAEFMQRHLPTFEFDRELWVRQAELLITLAHWDELRALAVDLRATQRQFLGLTGYAWFIEGLANYRSHLPEPAWEAFRKIPAWPVDDALLGYRMAKDLSSFGNPELAKEVLLSLEKAAGDTAEYWFHLVVASYEAHEFETMLAAAEKAHQLAPNNLVYINNYAAALLMQRKDPPLAAQLTLRKLTATPRDDGARLNHVLALLQNERTAEAGALLQEVDPKRLDSRLFTFFNLALFELKYREQRPREALAAYGQIESRFLLPPQLSWLEQTHARLVDTGH